jgi:hydrogenase maturation factor
MLLGPRVGEDVAAVLLGEDNVLVLKSDPVTFATDAIGRYAVIVSANDVATCGARPRWLLSSLLFPPESTATDILEVMRDLAGVAAEIGATVCGGHTEITDAVTRPVAVCQVAGTVSRSRLIDKRGMGAGDTIMVTKGIALEGCSIIAREFGAELQRRGIPEAALERCRGFLSRPGISILEEARIAAGSEGVSAMHDVTEGGIATALEELSAAGGHRIRINPAAIPILPEADLICRALDIDPMGLIASGSLLITCRPAASRELMKRLRDGGIAVTPIGEVLGPGEGVDSGGAVKWRSFEADEITRLFSGPPDA